MNIRHIKTYGTLLSIPKHVYVHTGWLRVQHLAHVLLRHTDRRSQDWMEMTCSGLVNITKQSISLNANWLDLSGRLPRAQTLVMEFWAKTDAFPSPSRWCAVTFLNYEFDPRNLWKVSCVAALRSRCKYYCFALKLKKPKNYDSFVLSDRIFTNRNIQSQFGPKNLPHSSDTCRLKL